MKLAIFAKPTSANMYKAICSLLFTSITVACTAQFPKSLKEVTNAVHGVAGGGGLSNDEVVAGLKEALEQGAGQAVSTGSAVDGFWNDAELRIPFPPEAEKVRSTLLGLGMQQQVEDFEHTMNQAAEEAVKEALPILRDAVLGMSIGDGFAILQGGDRAATAYLEDKATDPLREKFRPIVEQATAKVALSSAWAPLASAYNKAALFTGGRAVDPDLDAYVTERALDGLFTLIAREELRIRQDPVARTSELLQRVFGG